MTCMDANEQRKKLRGREMRLGREGPPVSRRECFSNADEHVQETKKTKGGSRFGKDKIGVAAAVAEKTEYEIVDVVLTAEVAED